MTSPNLTMDNIKIVLRDWGDQNYDQLLCRYYLPTVPQVFDAMGAAGIALWILGTLITSSLVALCVKQTYFICKYVHKRYDNHIFHITSIYFIMALMTSIGTVIPRASEICSATKDIYMAFGIGHFVDLILSIYGGEKAMISNVEGKLIRVNRLPGLCCCYFIPVCTVNGHTVTILKWLVWQIKWSQTVYYLFRLIIKTSQEDSYGITLPMDWEVYLNIGNLVSFLPGVISLILIGRLVRDDLEQRYNFTAKSRLVRLTIITTKFQRIIFEILEVSGVFPCYPPLVSQKFYKNIVKDFIYLIEVLILGILTFCEYTKPDIFHAYLPIGSKSKISKHEEENSVTENGVQDEALDTPTEHHGIESVC